MNNKTNVKRIAFISLSIFLALLGMALVVCPFIPKTPIFLAALVFACAGSDRLKDFVLNNKWYRRYAVALINKSKLARDIIIGLLGNEAVS